MKKIVSIAILALVLATVGGMAGAKAEPGPNGNNDHGLCTAYFNGQKNGHGPGEDPDDPPPFQGLEDHSREYTDNDGVDNDNDGQTDEDGENTSLSSAENVFNYCNDFGLIGGNPAHGRFDCEYVDEGQPSCEDNPAPGKSGKNG